VVEQPSGEVSTTQAAAVDVRLANSFTYRAYDALIAASALAENLPIYTCNPGDFEGIEGLEVRLVPHRTPDGLHLT